MRVVPLTAIGTRINDRITMEKLSVHGAPVSLSPLLFSFLCSLLNSLMSLGNSRF